MSCGDPHEPDCREALDNLHSFLDHELGPVDHERIVHHLEQCGPCLREFDVERIVRALVARSCCQVAPEQLRLRVHAQIMNVQVRVQRRDG